MIFYISQLISTQDKIHQVLLRNYFVLNTFHPHNSTHNEDLELAEKSSVNSLKLIGIMLIHLKVCAHEFINHRWITN